MTKRKTSRKIVTALLGLTILLSIWLYRSSFNSYFFQDDWFSLRISQSQNIQDILKFFVPRVDVVYYRPMGMQIPFFAIQSIFGINPLPFRVIFFIVHSINTLLVYYFIHLLTDRRKIALLSAFFFATSSIHFIPAFWASTFAFPLGFSFFSVTLILFLKWQKSKKDIYFFMLIFAEFAAHLTNELSLLLPVIILSYMIVFKKINKKIILALLFIPLLYIVMRLLYLPQLTGTYSIEFGKITIKSIFVYLLWLFNWPEEIRNQLGNILVFNFSFVSIFRKLFFVLFLETAVFATFIVLYILSFAKVKKFTKEVRVLIFSFLIIILGLLFIIPFPQHTYPYYLQVAGLGFFTLISYSVVFLISKSSDRKKILFYAVVIFIWVLSSVYSIEFYNKNHWVVQRYKISRIVTSDILSRFPEIKNDNKIYIYNDPYLKVILSGGEAFPILYDDLSIETEYYGDEDIIWKNVSDDNRDILENRLKLNYVR